jgi:peptidoglycan hydrolase-like amidase
MRGCRVALTLLVAAAGLVVPEGPRASAAVTPAREVIALVVEGVGFGHGRGMSQWGAYGRAVNGRQSWQTILNAYYGGTTLGSVATSSRIRVRLEGHDGDPTVGVVSTTRRAMWRGVGYMALQARATSTPNRYNIYSSSSFACPGATTSGWTLRAANVAGPVTFTTTMSEVSAPANQVLGLCHNDRSVTHYRGTIQLTRDSAGNRRVVNNALVESYLRGVVSREVSTSWGNAGGGAGMNALRAQAVAARSYALSQNRYSGAGGYATTCDSTACQLYGGAARRATITSPVATGGTCEGGNITFECANTNRAILDTAGRVRRWPDGRVVATEFSASNGPRTAGGVFPAIDDPYDNVPANPNHRWTRIIDGDLVGAAYGLGALSAAATEPDPATSFSGVWDNRVRLTGDNGTVVIGGWNFRGAFGLPSPGFVVRPVTRDVVSTNSMRMIGDFVGLSLSESSAAELPALLDGVFRTSAYDARSNRCTSGCTVSGVSAAASVPYGTDVVVVELGYNSPNTDFGARIDAVMRALHARQVERVVWVNLSERSGRAAYVAANQALNAARSRWADLYIIDWRTYSAGTAGNRNRWFAANGLQLTATGQAEMARYIRAQLLPRASFIVSSSLFARDQATGRWSVYSVNAWAMRQRYTGTWSTSYNFVVAGDFDRDGAVDDVLAWSRSATTYTIYRMSNYVPIMRTTGTFPAGYDDAIVGDFDSDGFVNDVLLWDKNTGNYRIYSTAGFVPTLRFASTFPTIYDSITIGDFDGDRRLDDAVVWDRDFGAWVLRSFYQFRSTVRSNATFPRGYDVALNGDLDQDTGHDDLILIDFQTGTAITYSWYAGRPTFRSTVTFSSTFDAAVVADLDDDRNHNETLLFDKDSRGWHIYTWTAFRPTLARAATWPLAYDQLVEGVFG